MGCRFYLDDFGSGYASFSSLKDLPVDYVKIDGIFIKDLLSDRASQTMVKSVTEIAHFMGRQVIAEFVENQQTVDALKTIGVDFIQGYHIGRPVPLHEVLRIDALCRNYRLTILSDGKPFHGDSARVESTPGKNPGRYGCVHLAGSRRRIVPARLSFSFYAGFRYHMGRKIIMAVEPDAL